MFLVGELGATISADRKPFDRTLNSVFRDGGRMMKRLGTQMTAALTLPLAGAGALAIKTAADYEKLETSMSVLNGSVEEGARQFERLQEFSARTPFQLRDLAQAQNMLQGFGLTADEAFDSLSMIGDIAAVSGGDIQGIGVAFGQAAAEGKLMSRDIRQLVNQGVPAIKLLADTMGVAQDEVFDLASEGEISFEILQKAFREATSEGGMFADGMRKQSQTISGLFSTLKDNASIALGEIGNSLVETFDIKGLIQDLTESIQTGINWFNSLSDETRAMAFKVAGLIGAGGPILVALGTLTAAFAAISWPVVLGVTAISGAVAAIISNWDEVVQYFTQGEGKQMWNTISELAKGMGEELLRVFEELVTAIIIIWDKWGEEFIAVVRGAIEIVGDIFGMLANMFSAVLNIMQGDWTGFWVDILQSASSALSKVQPALAAALSMEAAALEARNYKQTMSQTQKDVRDEISRTKGWISDLVTSFGGRSTFDISVDTNLDEEVRRTTALSQEMIDTFLFASQILNETWMPAMEAVTEESERSSTALIGALNILDNVFQQAVLHGQKLENILGKIAKQLASKALINGLAMLLSGGAFSVGSLLFGSVGSIIGVNDALVRSNGDIVKFHPDDNLLAMKDFSNLMPSGDVRPMQGRSSSLSGAQMERAFGRALDRKLQQLGPNDIFALSQRGSVGY